MLHLDDSCNLTIVGFLGIENQRSSLMHSEKQGWHPQGQIICWTTNESFRQPAADVRCWAYNPPGGLCSANLSAAMKPFCTSVIVSKDAISRMSLKNISGMIDEMLIALARCKQPTLKVRRLRLLCLHRQHCRHV